MCMNVFSVHYWTTETIRRSLIRIKGKRISHICRTEVQWLWLGPKHGLCWLHLPEVLVSACGCWALIGAGCSPCVPIGAVGWSPCVPIGAGWMPWALIGAGWIPCALMGAGWIPWMWRAWDASTVISCMGLRWTVEATPTPVWAVMAELGAWAETGTATQTPRHTHPVGRLGPPLAPCTQIFTFKDYSALKN